MNGHLRKKKRSKNIEIFDAEIQETERKEKYNKRRDHMARKSAERGMADIDSELGFKFTVDLL